MPLDGTRHILGDMGSNRSELAAEAYREHRGDVYRFLLRKTGDHHDAEELTQRVFADAAAALQHYNDRPQSLLAWLYAVAERRFVDEVRRRSVARRRLPHLVAREDATDLTFGHEICVALREAIGALPDDQREVVVMKLLEGRSFREIAEKTQASEAACKMRLSRAIAKVKTRLEERGLAPDA